jgi:serine/threonine protein kinase
MAPEQVRGELDKIGPATDIYGLGAILYECLTGRKPFQGASISVLYQIIEQSPPSPRQVRPDIPVSLERVCLKCLEKDPRKRYAGADKLAQALEQFLAQAASEHSAHIEPAGDEAKPLETQLTRTAGLERPQPSERQTLLARVRQWFAPK